MDNKTWIPEYDDPASAQYQQLTSDFCGDVSQINVSVRPSKTLICTAWSLQIYWSCADRQTLMASSSSSLMLL